MGEEEKPFRFLTNEEFGALPLDAKLGYVTLAALKLEERQKELRALIRALNDEFPKA